MTAFSPIRRTVGHDEIMALRRTTWSDGVISTDEADALFSLNDQAEPSAEWTDAFVEAIGEYCIARGQPRGFVTQADADWLVGHIVRDGTIDSHAELDLVVRLFEKANAVPDSLKQFALASIEQAVLSGSGPTRAGGDFAPGKITDAEVALLRRFLFTASGDAPAKVSRGEAEMLFRLKDASLGQDNTAGWQTLFVQGVANYLMANEYFEMPTAEREREIRADYQPNLGRFMLATIRAVPHSPLFKRDGLKAVANELNEEQRLIRQHDADVARDAEVTSDEQAWLDRSMAADAALDPLEQALADFLEREHRARD